MNKQSSDKPSIKSASMQAKDSLFYARLLLVILYFCVAVVYFIWRVTIFNPDFPIYSTIFYFSELVGFVWLGINLLSLLRFKRRSVQPVSSGISVDIFVPTYNEPIDIVRRTVIAAMRISYDHKTWILDDGNRPAMKKLADDLGCCYIARKDNEGAKAGNLNNALSQTEGEFIVIFDADFIAAPSFLDKTLGYFSDPKVAFVQTPQEFYNFDSYQHIGKNRARELWSEHSLFFHAQQRGRDVDNAAMFCGSSAVLRRAALEDVGGFASTTVTEDMHTSTLLHANGWSSVYYPETLSVGLAPHDSVSFQNQRIRWAAGAMQIARQEGLFAGGLNLTFRQRLAYLLHVGSYIEGPRHIFLYIASAVTLVFYISPIQVSFLEWAIFYIPFLFIGFLAYKELARGYTKIIKNEIFNMARCPALMRAMSALFSKKHIPFKITPKVRGKAAPFIFPWVILAINVIALLKASYDEFFGEPRIDGWPIMIIVVWCCLGAWLAWSVCCLTRRCNKNRRVFSRFPVDLKVRLQHQDTYIDASAVEIADSGLSIILRDTNMTLPSGRYLGTIVLQEQEIQFDLSLRPVLAGEKSGGCISFTELTTQDDYLYGMMMGRIEALEAMKYSDDRTYLRLVAGAIQKLSKP